MGHRHGPSRCQLRTGARLTAEVPDDWLLFVDFFGDGNLHNRARASPGNRQWRRHETDSPKGHARRRVMQLRMTSCVAA